MRPTRSAPPIRSRRRRPSLRLVRAHSNMAILSFHPVKHVTTGEGGAITTNDSSLFEVLSDLRSHGITKDPAKLETNDGPWYYEQRVLGFNYRITDIQCALGLSQAKKFPSFLARRRAIAADAGYPAFAAITASSCVLSPRTAGADERVPSVRRHPRCAGGRGALRSGRAAQGAVSRPARAERVRAGALHPCASTARLSKEWPLRGTFRRRGGLLLGLPELTDVPRDGRRRRGLRGLGGHPSSIRAMNGRQLLIRADADERIGTGLVCKNHLYARRHLREMSEIARIQIVGEAFQCRNR